MQIGETWTCFASSFCQASSTTTSWASSHSLHPLLRRSLPLPPHFLPRHGTFDPQSAGSSPMASPSPLTLFSHSCSLQSSFPPSLSSSSWAKANSLRPLPHSLHFPPSFPISYSRVSLSSSWANANSLRPLRRCPHSLHFPLSFPISYSRLSLSYSSSWAKANSLHPLLHFPH